MLFSLWNLRCWATNSAVFSHRLSTKKNLHYFSTDNLYHIVILSCFMFWYNFNNLMRDLIRLDFPNVIDTTVAIKLDLVILSYFMFWYNFNNLMRDLIRLDFPNVIDTTVAIKLDLYKSLSNKVFITIKKCKKLIKIRKNKKGMKIFDMSYLFRHVVNGITVDIKE